MARGEIPVTCPHCGLVTSMPVGALRRDNYHCSRCGVHIPLSGVKVDLGSEGERPRRARSKRPFRPVKRR